MMMKMMTRMQRTIWGRVQQEKRGKLTLNLINTVLDKLRQVCTTMKKVLSLFLMAHDTKVSLIRECLMEKER
jgi:hypothetical protein